MRGWNERKLEVLEYARDHGEFMSGDLARDLSIEIHLARMLLLRYHRQGLLNRSRLYGLRTRIYHISKKGLKRIEWLKNI